MLIAIFCVAFVTTNIVTVKILDLGFWGLTVPCGVIIYPLVFILTSVIADTYGESTAQKTILFGVVCNLLFVVVSTIALMLPAAGFWEGQDSFVYIFSQTPRMLISSFISSVNSVVFPNRWMTTGLEISGAKSHSFITIVLYSLKYGSMLSFIWKRSDILSARNCNSKLNTYGVGCMSRIHLSLEVENISLAYAG